MKTNHSLKLILACFVLLIQVCGYGQKKEKSSVKKLNLLPVYMVYNGLPDKTSMDSIVKEAFSRHKVKLISRSEFEKLNQNEVMRVEAKLKAPGNKIWSERDARDAIAKEQRFVTNMLEVDFSAIDFGDSVIVSRASWSTTQFPPSINNYRSSGDIETVLEDTCCSVTDNLFTLIDKILLSKWLR